MRVPFALVLGPHGLKGEVKVSPLGLNVELLYQVRCYYLSKDDPQSLEVEEIKKGPGFNVFIVKFKEFTYEKARSLTKKVLYIETDALPEPEEDEFYYYQIIGFKVRDERGRSWGKVKEIMPLGEYELILVEKEDGREFYIPLVEEYVKEIDFKLGEIVGSNLEALFESQV